MDFKLALAVFCLASIRVSDAALAWSAATDTAAITECTVSGTTVSYTPTASGATATPVTYVLTSQAPDSTDKKFVVALATGALTTATSAMSTFDASTQLTYILVITASDASSPAEEETLTLTVTVTDTDCSSGAAIVIPSVSFILVVLVSLLIKNDY